MGDRGRRMTRQRRLAPSIFDGTNVFSSLRNNIEFWTRPTECRSKRTSVVGPLFRKRRILRNKRENKTGGVIKITRA